MNLSIVLRDKACFWAVEWTICVVKVCFGAIFVLLWTHPGGYKRSIFTKFGMWLLCLWVTTAVVWGSFGHHLFGVCGWKLIFWAWNGVQMMQRKETYLANRATNAFRWWFVHRRNILRQRIKVTQNCGSWFRGYFDRILPQGGYERKTSFIKMNNKDSIQMGS